MLRPLIRNKDSPDTFTDTRHNATYGCTGVAFAYVQERMLIGMADCIMKRADASYRKLICKYGRMNPYESEGPSARQRAEIKNINKHGLLCVSLNKSSIQSALSYLASTMADIALVQELTQKRCRFFDTKGQLQKGTYMHRADRSSDRTWKCEGTPIYEDPNRRLRCGSHLKKNLSRTQNVFFK